MGSSSQSAMDVLANQTIIVDLHGATILRHPRGEFCLSVRSEPYAQPTVIKNGRMIWDGYMVVPLPGPHWFRRAYYELAAALGRKGRRL